MDSDYLFANVLQCSPFRSTKQNQIADVLILVRRFKKWKTD